MNAPIRHVVLIEDNAAHAKLVERLLGRTSSLALEWFDRLEPGLARLQTGEADVVLLDLGLPDSERHETLGRVLEAAPHVPVIVLTTAEDLDAAIESVKQGAQDDLPKSQLSRELLVRAIRYAIERKQAERRIRESERLYRAIGESIDFGVWVCDADGRNVYASASFLVLTGMTQEECSSFGWSQTLHPDDREATLEAWKQCVRAGSFWNRQHRILGTDGRYHPVLARGVPVYDEQGRITCWAGINLDISELKRAEGELKSLNATLEQRVAERTAEAEERTATLRLLASELSQAEHRERGRLAQILHDNLQQILVAAKMRADVLSGRLTEDRAKEQLHQVADLIGQSIEEARSLTLDLSPPVLRDRGLGAALEWLARRKRERYQLEVKVEVEGDSGRLSDGAGALLFEATRELLFNTVKHADARTAHVRLDCRDPEEAKVEVSDNGVGFEPAVLHCNASTTEHFGLFSIRERLELMGGQLHVDSAPGRGAQITMRVPYGSRATPGFRRQAVARTTAAPSGAARAARPADEPARIRVLLVDDHQVVREGLSGMIGAEPDIQIVGEAADGPAALAMVDRLQPDAVLMDVSLPGMSGVEVTRQIVEHWPNVRVIGLSMHDPADVASAMLAAGAVAYHSKAGPTEPLLASIRACIAATSADER